MRFFIQAGHPRSLHVPEIPARPLKPEDLTLNGLIELVFPIVTERMIWSWNHVEIAIPYHEAGVIFEDGLELCETILANDYGDLSIAWVLQGYESVWHFAWTTEEVVITANSHNVFGTGLETLLNRFPQIRMAREEFLAEWKAPFRNVIVAVEASGLPGEALAGIAVLKRTEAAIPGKGFLYR